MAQLAIKGALSLPTASYPNTSAQTHAAAVGWRIRTRSAQPGHTPPAGRAREPEPAPGIGCPEKSNLPAFIAAGTRLPSFPEPLPSNSHRPALGSCHPDGPLVKEKPRVDCQVPGSTHISPWLAPSVDNVSALAT